MKSVQALNMRAILDSSEIQVWSTGMEWFPGLVGRWIGGFISLDVFLIYKDSWLVIWK